MATHCADESAASASVTTVLVPDGSDAERLRSVARDDLDLISIATPVGLHAPIFLAALAAGKHVLCEKPLALSGAQGR